MTYDFIVVGAGFFGAVFAREVKDAGKSVLVLEKRNHIGGNCYDFAFEDSGITVPLYGPHIFHTDSLESWQFVQRYARFNRYQHRVLTTHENRVYAMPINLGTINAFYGVNLRPADVAGFLAKRIPENVAPKNFEEKAVSLVGRELYEAFIKGYSTKQWKTDLTRLPAEVIARLPVRYSHFDSYYDDRYQGMPLDGYTPLFEELLRGIPAEMNVDFLVDREQWLSRCRKLVYTGPIDEFFGRTYGALRWGSVRFETEFLELQDYQGTSVMNYADLDVPHTRIVEPKHFYRERESFTRARTVILREYAELDHERPYYPVRLAEDLELLARYQALARGQSQVIFGGRLAEYKYYDMDDVIALARGAARTALAEGKG